MPAPLTRSLRVERDGRIATVHGRCVGGGIPRVLREVPPAVARDLVLTGREFDAREARRLGVVPRVHPDEGFDAEVAALTAEVAGKAALPVRATLDAVAATLGIGAPLGWSDADTLLTAIRDPESREAARRYLARW